ncbi:hypothetical protein NPIL_401841 [Nephila pilipes]|uniref:Uncharacterized protein n=1 Tax=Nephila pilipes TaxID=299642 RepID=A0A8X6Q9L8_NEPPI|nr:hypothetical protein NPIL_401841 [Nephila pilipes]
MCTKERSSECYLQNSAFRDLSSPDNLNRYGDERKITQSLQRVTGAKLQNRSRKKIKAKKGRNGHISTRLGKFMKNGRIKSLEEIYVYSLPMNR